MSGVVELPPLQNQPASMEHAEEQPSPPSMLPSSQPSAPMRRLSPHTAVAQNWALVLATVYVLPGNAALHVLWLAAGLLGVAVE
jgi:hypothetical protein